MNQSQMPHHQKSHLPAFMAAISLGLLLLFSLFSTLLTLGQQLTQINRFLGYFFYLLVAICAIFGIIYPIFCVFGKPIFSMYMLRDKHGRAKRYWCRKLIDNLTQNTDLSEAEKQKLPEFLQQGDLADDLLIHFFKEKFSPMVDEQIVQSAKAAFAATAISQTALYDMLSMLSVNLHQIRAIVETCGYRPSNAALFGLYIRILKAAFLAGGMEEIDLEELLPLISGNAALKLPGIVFASAAQGTVNAFTTIRVGIITKKYLFSENEPISMKQARKDSYKEALAFLKTSSLYKDLFSIISKQAEHLKNSAVESVKKAAGNMKKNFWPPHTDQKSQSETEAS